MDAPPHIDDHEATIGRNARYGLVLFAIYILLYGGFMWLTVFRTEAMGREVFGGMNLAIAYGFGLIAAALVLALIYMALCGRGVPRNAGEGASR